MVECDCVVEMLVFFNARETGEGANIEALGARGPIGAMGTARGRRLSGCIFFLMSSLMSELRNVDGNKLL